MTEKSLEERVTALEAQLGDKTLEQHFRGQAELIDRRFTESFRDQAELFDRRFAEAFREQAELIDRLFVYRFDEFDKKWETRLDSTLEEKFEAKLRPINETLKVILARLP